MQAGAVLRGVYDSQVMADARSESRFSMDRCTYPSVKNTVVSP